MVAAEATACAPSAIGSKARTVMGAADFRTDPAGAKGEAKITAAGTMTSAAADLGAGGPVEAWAAAAWVAVDDAVVEAAGPQAGSGCSC